MTSNFWVSQHCNKWILDSDTVSRSHAKVRIGVSTDTQDKDFLTDTELHALRIFYPGWLGELGEYLKLRQRVIATAIVYWKRFYLKNSFLEFEPVCSLVAPSLPQRDYSVLLVST